MAHDRSELSRDDFSWKPLKRRTLRILNLSDRTFIDEAVDTFLSSSNIDFEELVTRIQGKEFTIEPIFSLVVEVVYFTSSQDQGGFKTSTSYILKTISSVVIESSGNGSTNFYLRLRKSDEEYYVTLVGSEQDRQELLDKLEEITAPVKENDPIQV